MRDPADRDVAGDGQALAGHLDLAGLEAQLRVALRVEELRGLQVRGQVLVLDVDAGDPGRALEGRLGQLGVTSVKWPRGTCRPGREARSRWSNGSDPAQVPVGSAIRY